jgi:hypothetical protein
MVQREQADKKDLEGEVQAVPHRRRIWQSWPMGLTALAVIVLSWFGLYLMWRGIAPLIGL